MATHSVNVLIKARDEASKKFAGRGISGKAMGTVLKAAVRRMRQLLAKRALNTIRKTSRLIER